MTEFNFSNLMDLATVDTSDLNAQTSRLQREGIYIIDLSEVRFTEQPAADPADPINFQLVSKGTILFFEPAKEEERQFVEKMVGTDLRERFFLSGKEMREAIQLLMGRYKTVGFKHKGVMGGIEGMAGWIDEALGKRVAIRVRHYVNKNGQDAASIDWLSPKQIEKSGLVTWEMLSRDFLDEKGDVVDLAA